jgi:hypothetical protein
MSDTAVGTPRCFVDIYPFEGGKYTFTGNEAGLRSVEVTKGVNANDPGMFSFDLAPGGPFGPNVRPQWLELLTPMSLCVIGMQRAGYKQIVMVGIIIAVSEPQEFQPRTGVNRNFKVSGLDLQYYFAQRNFYALNLLAALGQVPFGQVGALSILSNGLLFGTPEKLGSEWFLQVMAGTKGLLANTSFSYNGQRIKFTDMITTKFEHYPADLSVPMGDYFMANEGSWMFKFTRFFPAPWYEFFVITAPDDQYPVKVGEVPVVQAKTPITMTGFKPVTTQLVARVNPLPYLEHAGSTTPTNAPPELTLNTSYWDKLITYSTDIGSPIAQLFDFDEGDVRNFYILNPLWSPFQYGQSNASLAPFVYTFAAWADPASINRYGYRPQVAEVHWLSDIKGQGAQQNAEMGKSTEDFGKLVTALSLKQVSFFHPTPLMARGAVTINLRPDILPGHKFVFHPFKTDEEWIFYIDSVQHAYRFGSAAVTTLTLSRGLPTKVYQDNKLLLAIFTGNAMRQDGVYTASLPPDTGKGLQPVNQSSMQGVLGQIIEAFRTPGKT